MSSSMLDLTQREHEILQHVARGLTNIEIAEELHIAEGTVKSHLSSVYAKMGVTNRTQAAVATRTGNLGLGVPDGSAEGEHGSWGRIVAGGLDPTFREGHRSPT